MDTNKPEIRDTLSATALDVSSSPTPTVRRHRRQYNTGFKCQVVEETLAGTDSVSVVARRYDINANLLFRWRKEHAQGKLSDKPQSLIPISVSTDPVTSCPPHSYPSSPGHVQINLNNDHQVVVSGQVDTDQLQAVLSALTTC